MQSEDVRMESIHNKVKVFNVLKTPISCITDNMSFYPLRNWWL